MCTVCATGALRCFQRATLLSLASPPPARSCHSGRSRSWLPLPTGGAILLRYVVSRPPSTDSDLASEISAESATHGDLIHPPYPDAEWAPEPHTDQCTAHTPCTSHRWRIGVVSIGGVQQPLTLWSSNCYYVCNGVCRRWACAAKIFYALRAMSEDFPRSHFVAIADDDTFIHPVRT